MGLFSFLKSIPVIGDVVGAAEDLFGVGDSSAKALQGNQAEINKDTALWNMENVTKPVFEMENEEWNRRFNAQNTEWERQWNMQNLYNSPAAQVQRMREAGFNPAGIDMSGGGTAAQGSVGSPTVNEAASAMAQPASVFEAMTAKSQSRLAQANALSALQKLRLTEREIQEKTINNKTLAELNQGRVELQNCQIETEKSTAKLNRAKAAESKALLKQIDATSRKIEAEIPNLEQELKNTKEQFFLIRAQRFATEAQEAKTDAETANAKADHVYKTIVNQYAEENQKWLINEIKSRFNLNNTEAYQALQAAKSIVQEGTIKDWKFKNSKYAWNKAGKWEVDFSGEIANWKYKNANMMTNVEESKIQFEQLQRGIAARFFVIQNIINAINRKGESTFGKMVTGSGAFGIMNKATGTEGYQFFE